VPAGVGVAQGVVVDIRIPVQRLRVPGLRHQGVGLQEAAQGRVIETRPVVIQARPRLPRLAGIEAVLGEDPILEPKGPTCSAGAKAIARLFAC
jgi:hypothetical protein